MAVVPLSLRSYLGADLDEVDHEKLLMLVGVRESDVLDVKSELYNSSEKSKRELVLDIAAFANAAGGLILLGGTETNDLIDGFPGVLLPDDEIIRMRRIVTDRIAPYLDCAILSVEVPDTDRVVVVVAVERSINAPHAVVDGATFRYVTRAGEQRRPIHESEVASLFAQRFTTGARRTERISEIYTSASDLDLGGGNAWLVLAAVPEIAGSATVVGDAKTRYRDFLQSVAGHLPQQQPGHVGRCVNVTTKMRRFVASDRHIEDEPKYSTSILEGHADGSVLICFAVGRLLGDGMFYDSLDQRSDDDKAVDDAVIFDEGLVYTLIEALHLAGCHAALTGAGGNLDLVAGLIRGGPDEAEERTMSLGHSRGHIPGHLGVRRLHSTERAGHTLAIDTLATMGPELLGSAWFVGSDITSAFGHSQVAQLTPEGQLDWRYVSKGYRPYIGSWAQRHEIEVLNNG